MKKGLYFVLGLIATLHLSEAASAQSSSLVKKVNGGNYISNSGISSGGKFFYFSNYGNFCELWCSDGTETGTKMLKRIGIRILNTNLLVKYDHKGILFFWADDDADGKFDLWKSDGTESGTGIVKVFNYQSSILGGVHISWGEVNGKLQFFLHQTAQLWQTDGTESGTLKLSSFPISPTSYNKAIVVNSNWIVEYNFQLWIIEPMSQTPKKLSEITADALYPVLSDGKVAYFYVDFFGSSALDGVLKTDGTVNGTKMVSEKQFNTRSVILYKGSIYLGDGPLSKFDEINGKVTVVDSSLVIGDFFVLNETLYATRFSNGAQNPDLLYKFDENSNSFKLIRHSLLSGEILGIDKLEIQKNYFFHSIDNQLFYIARVIETDNYFYYLFSLNRNDFVSKQIDYIKDINFTSTGIIQEIPKPYLDKFTALGYELQVGNEVFFFRYPGNEFNLHKLSLCSHQVNFLAPKGKSICAGGGSLPITVDVTGKNTPFTYNWIFKDSNGNSNLAGSTKDITVSKPGSYAVYVADNKGCLVAGYSGEIVAGNVPVAISGSTSLCSGASTTLTATLSGGVAPFTYQWKQGTANTGTNNTLVATTAGLYTVTVTDSKGCIGTSTSVTLTQKTAPTAVVTPGGTTSISTGASVILSTPSATGRSYQWSKNGQPLTGAINNTYTATEPGDYTVTVVENGCSVTSAVAKIVSSGTLTVSISGATNFCSGQSTSLTANATGGTGPYTYQWKQGITNVGTINTLTVNLAGNYTVTVTDSKGIFATSTSTDIVQKPTPTVTIGKSGPLEFLPGGNVILSVPAVTGQTYQWSKGGQPIAGATNNTYTAKEPGEFSVTVVRDGCSATSVVTKVSLITGLEPSPAGLSLRLSPNPASTRLRAELTLSAAAPAEFTLLGPGGEALQTRASRPAALRHEVEFPLAGLPAGPYYLRAEAEGKRVVRKVVKGE